MAIIRLGGLSRRLGGRATHPSVGSRSYSRGGAIGAYYLDFTALAANEDPLSQGGIWTNNTQGTGGNAAMNTQTSMRVALSADSSTRICCDTSAVIVNYEDSFAFVPGYSGNQRVTATIYKEAGYAPTNNHEMEVFLGAVVYGNNDKRAVECLISIAGSWVLVVHNGAMSGSTFTVISSSTVSGGVPANGDVVVCELDRTAKTIKVWNNGTLKCSTQWATTHDEIDGTVQGYLNSLGNGAGLAGLRRAGDTAAAKFGFRNVRIESF